MLEWSRSILNVEWGCQKLLGMWEIANTHCEDDHTFPWCSHFGALSCFKAYWIFINTFFVPIYLCLLLHLPDNRLMLMNDLISISMAQNKFWCHFFQNKYNICQYVKSTSLNLFDLQGYPTKCPKDNEYKVSLLSLYCQSHYIHYHSSFSSDDTD